MQLKEKGEHMSLLDKSLKRRDFLKGTAAAAAATAAFGLSGCSTGTAQDAGSDVAHVVASDTSILADAGEWMPIHCHQNCNQMCLNMGYVVDGVVVRQKTDDAREDSFDCPQQRGCLRGRSLRQQVYNADRIKYPMKRKSWQPGGGENAHGELRGKDEWERIGWDEALDLVVGELKRVYAEYGQDAVICNGWRWAPGSAMFPVIGGAVYNTETESFGCWAFQTEALGLYSWGDHPDIMMGPDKYDLPNADTIVLYGCNPAWAQHSSMYWLNNAKESGTGFVYVGPSYNVTAAQLGARWIRVRPGTDTAFLLAVIYEMIRLDEERGDVIDWDFVNERTVGFTPETMPEDAATDENYRDYILGAYDGTPKTPEWASEICGTPVEDITWYAELAAKDNKVIFFHSYAASRYLGAENLPQAFMTVSALGGHYGKSGHGSAAIYTWDAGDSGYRLIQHAGGEYAYIDNLVGSPGATGPNRCIEGNSWWSSLAEGKYLSSSEGPYDLGSGDDPAKLRANTPTYHAAREMPVNPRLMFATNSNFMQTRGNLPTAIKVMRAADTCISLEIKYSLTASFADIILPAAHPNEVDRVEWAHSGHGYPTSHTYLIRQPFHEPLGECKDDMDICFEFAKYMDVDMYWKDKYEFFDYMVKGPETLPPQLSCANFEEFRERISVTGVEMATVKNAPKYETGFMRKTSDFRPGFNTMYRGNKMGSVYRFPGAKKPDGTVIPPHPQSDNGKMELWSEDLLLYGNGALPMYIEPPITKISRPDLLDEYPYTLITGGRSHAFFHTEYRNSPWMREVHMFPTMDINPATAAEHGIEQDDWVYIETYVDRIKQRANLTEAIKPGMIHVEHDWWFPEREATDDLHGAFDSNCNVLFENNGPYDPAVGTDNYGGLCKVYKADDGAPKNICMNSEDLKIFLPLTADQLAADDQQNGVTQVTKGGAK